MTAKLWTDLMEPYEATAIARDEQYVIEQRRGGTLARFLPNVLVDSDHVKVQTAASGGLVDVARYRAFNARPEIGKGPGGRSMTIDLPSIARSEPLDEMTQKELARLPEGRIRKGVEASIKRNVQAMSMRQELTRGIAIDQGRVLVDQDNFLIDDNFARDAAMSSSLGSGNWWNDPAVDRLSQLATLFDAYAGFNDDVRPGRIVFGSRQAFNAFAAGNQFKTTVGAATRPPLRSEVESYVASADLADMEIYDRTVSVDGALTKVLNPKKIYLLPEPTNVDSEEGSLLGATYWGRTVSSTFESWGIEPDEQPGIVCGVFKDERVGASVEVEGDAIGEPVLANPNASMAIQVLQ